MANFIMTLSPIFQDDIIMNFKMTSSSISRGRHHQYQDDISTNFKMILPLISR
uniref:Uncharacterized protein n=1 Tax=Octopus bimaculoides TaxID=37653 RepID=A0A0L8GY19_OCTBM